VVDSATLVDMATNNDAALWSLKPLNTMLQASGFHIVAIAGEAELQQTVEQLALISARSKQSVLAAAKSFER
jgi:hypothetical protein